MIQSYKCIEAQRDHCFYHSIAFLGTAGIQHPLIFVSQADGKLLPRHTFRMYDKVHCKNGNHWRHQIAVQEYSKLYDNGKRNIAETRLQFKLCFGRL